MRCLPALVQCFAGANHRRNAELTGTDRHVRVGATELSDEPADSARKDPVETRVSARHKQYSAREALWGVIDRGDRCGDAFARDEIRLARGQMKGEDFVGRGDHRRQYEAARERMSLSAARDAIEQSLPYRTALAIERADRVVVEEGTILDGKTIFLAHLPNQRQGVAQAAREHELRILTPLDTRLDE